MRILAVGDVAEPLLHEYFKPDRWKDDQKIDLLVSCGDLSANYLDFLISVFGVPGFYVAGNHDVGYQEHPPPGWDNLDGKVVDYQGVRFVGLAGCMRYTADPQPFQYSEAQMGRRAWRLRLPLWRAGGADVIISHAAPAICPVAYYPCVDPVGEDRPCAHPEFPGHLEKCPDARDTCHRGFLAFHQMIERYHPGYWLHGHNHLTYGRAARIHTIGQTSIINVYGHTIIDVEPRA